MMRFRTLKKSVADILTAAAAGEYRVISHQDQGISAEEIKDNWRTVRVYYKKGAFPKSMSSTDGPIMHNVTLSLELIASKAAKGDVATLESETATDVQRAAALLGFETATAGADEALDELIDLVFNVLMAADQTDLGLEVGNIANRWIDEAEKMPLPRQGQYVVIGAEMNLTCRVVEDLTGAAIVAAEDPATTTSVEVNQPGSSEADAAPAEVSGGN